MPAPEITHEARSVVLPVVQGANLLSKIGRFLEHGNAEQDWVAVVIYPNRELEQKNLHPYRCLLESDQLVRIYLDELPPAPPDQFEMGILELIAAEPETALKKAQAMVPRLRVSKQPRQFQRTLLQLVERYAERTGLERSTASGFDRSGVPDGHLVAQPERQARDVIEL